MTGHWRMNSPKMKYHAELFLPGPIRTEARRLAKEELRKHYAKQGTRLDWASAQEVDNGITVLLYGAQEHFLKLAKFNLGEGR